MSQIPKKEVKLPKDILDRSDSEVAEIIFGKRLKRELDKEIESIDRKGVPDFMKE